MPFLENELIRLRSPEPEDLEILYMWENDTGVWQTGVTHSPFSKYTLSKYIETAHLDIFEAKQIRLIIELKHEGNKAIGAVDIFEYDSFNNRAGLGILIAENKDRQKGYALATLQLTCQYCFTTLDMMQVYCNIDTENTASINLFTKLGFESIGIKKRWTRRHNGYHDEVLMQLINPKYL
jgi:diamine N-acetyltransferase